MYHALFGYAILVSMRYHFPVPLSSIPASSSFLGSYFPRPLLLQDPLNVSFECMALMRSGAMTGALLYLLSASVVAALTLPSEPKIVTPESLPLLDRHSNTQLINLNSTARSDSLDVTGVEGYRNLLLPGIVGMPHDTLLPLYLRLTSLHPLLSISPHLNPFPSAFQSTKKETE